MISFGGPQAEHLAAFFIKTCLTLDTFLQNDKTLACWTPQEKDYLLCCIFDSQKSLAITGVDLLYRSVCQLSDIQKRQQYLLKFFELVRGNSQPQYVRGSIFTSCHFSQVDIMLLVEACQNKLTI